MHPYRDENIFGKFEIRFTAVSNMDGIKSNLIPDYSAIILNPYNSKTGFDALRISYFRRSLSKGGGFVNYLRYLYDKEEINSKTFDEIISQYNDKFKLEKYKKLIYRFGYALEGNISNFTWINSNEISKNGNIVAINTYFTFNSRIKFLDDVVDITGGIGPAIRIIAGSIRNDKEYLKSIVENDRTEYIGTQLSVQAYIAGFYATGNYAIFGGKSNVEGLTGGQFYASIGIQANIGIKSANKRSIDDILRRDLKNKK